MVLSWATVVLLLVLLLLVNSLLALIVKYVDLCLAELQVPHAPLYLFLELLGPHLKICIARRNL